MRRFNVVVSDEAGEILDKYRDALGLKSLDNAMDKFLIEHKQAMMRPLSASPSQAGI